MADKPFYEKFIERHFPTWASSRAEARAHFEQLRIENEMRGGMATRLTEAFSQQTSYKYQTASERHNSEMQCYRARQTYQNNPFGRALVDTETDNVVGDGFSFQAQTSSPDFNREVTDYWYDWIDHADIRNTFTGSALQRMTWSKSRYDGDIGTAFIVEAGKLRLQTIARDLIKTPDGMYGKIDEFGTQIIDGIEFNRVGQPMAYHILDADEYGKRKFTRVAAENFIHLAHIDDPNQIRGLTCYSTIFDLLNHLDRYIDGVSTAAWMATVFGLIFKESGAAKTRQSLSTMTDASGNQQRAMTFENGMLKWVGQADETVQVDAKQPMAQTPEFVRTLLRLVGIPFNMPLEMIAKDLSTCNFASARIGLNGFYRSCRIKQEFFECKWLDTVFARAVTHKINTGGFVSALPADYLKHKFIGMAWDYTDPVTDVQSDLLQIDMGVKSPQMVMEERSRNADQITTQLKDWKKNTSGVVDPIKSTMTRDPGANMPSQPKQDNANA